MKRLQIIFLLFLLISGVLAQGMRRFRTFFAKHQFSAAKWRSAFFPRNIRKSDVNSFQRTKSRLVAPISQATDIYPKTKQNKLSFGARLQNTFAAVSQWFSAKRKQYNNNRYNALLNQVEKGDFSVKVDNYIGTILKSGITTQKAKELYNALSVSAKGRDILCNLLNDEKVGSLLASYVKKDVLHLAQYQEGVIFCKRIAKQYPEIAKDMLQQIDTEFESFYNQAYAAQILKVIQNYTDNNDQSLFAHKIASGLQKKAEHAYGSGEQVFTSLAGIDRITTMPNQTDMHMQSNKPHVLESVSNHADMISPEVVAVVNDAYKKEHELKNDYYTFYHGQGKQFGLLNRWNTKLWELKYKQACEDFVCTQLEGPETDMKAEKKVRKKLLENGGDRSRLQYVNHALFGNAQREGCNSLFYMLYNYNDLTGLKGKKVSFKQLFADLGYTNVYRKHKKELQKLEQEHVTLTPYGQLLLYAVPKAQAKECIMPVDQVGNKKKITIDGIGRTDNMNLIMETLRRYPDRIIDNDTLEFALVKTWDLALHPNSGIKIFPYMPIKQQRLEQFKQCEDTVFKTVQKDIQEHENNRNTSFWQRLYKKITHIL